MTWYKARMVVPGIDGDVESGFCGLQYWDEHVEAEHAARVKEMEEYPELPFQ